MEAVESSLKPSIKETPSMPTPARLPRTPRQTPPTVALALAQERIDAHRARILKSEHEFRIWQAQCWARERTMDRQLELISKRLSRLATARPKLTLVARDTSA